MEEERRLAFVAMTRAEKSLILTDAEGRNFNNTYRYPSRFVLDIDRKYISYDSELPEDLLRQTKDWIMKGPGSAITKQELPFHEKDRVFHKVFGEGTIQKINFREGSVEIKFDRFERERVLTIAALDKMEKR
jgi:DNA helicase-2/ATP-dependent DNA helicase PcrA